MNSCTCCTWRVVPTSLSLLCIIEVVSVSPVCCRVGCGEPICTSLFSEERQTQPQGVKAIVASGPIPSPDKQEGCVKVQICATPKHVDPSTVAIPWETRDQPEAPSSSLTYTKLLLPPHPPKKHKAQKKKIFMSKWHKVCVCVCCRSVQDVG